MPTIGLSILVPSLNSGRYLIEAVQSALSQLDDVDEIVVQDGGSTDGSVEALLEAVGGDARVRVDVSPDSGQSDALTKALARAVNPYFGWLNADDYYYPGSLAAAREALAADPELDVVFGGSTLVDEHGTIVRSHRPGPFTTEAFLRNGCHVFSGSTLFRCAAVQDVGGFDKDLHYCMDFDLYLRLTAAGATAQALAVDVGAFRQHSASKSSRNAYSFVREALQVEWRYAPNLTGRLRGLGFATRYFLVLTATPLRHSKVYSRLRGVKTYR